MIASQRQYSLDFSEKFKIYSILKRRTSLYKIILVNYFQVNGRSLEQILWKKICGMEIKFMRHDCIAKTIFPGFQWKIQNILYIKNNNQLIQNNFSKLFSGKWTVLSINIMEKTICGMEIKFMSHDCIAKTIFPGFQWKIQNILYIKNNNQLIQNNFSKLFSGKWTVLSINIMEKNMWNGN